jgi:RHS repeat-associated protein
VGRFLSEDPMLDENEVDLSPLEVYEGGASYYYHADALGTITTLTKRNGSVVNTYTYTSFGDGRYVASETVANPFQYTAREYDPETELYYYRARYYDPVFGRFLSEDPSQFTRGISLYAYVFNDPANEVDPSGLAECFYRISTHTLECVSRANVDSPPIVVGPESVSSGAWPCKDRPACTNVRDLGPIVPGEYRMNRDLRAGHEGIYRLEPIPHHPWWDGLLVRMGLKRGGFELHRGTRTVGCINVLKTDESAMNEYRELLKLLEAEDGRNYLLVAP